MSEPREKIRFVRANDNGDEMLRDKDNAKPKAPAPSWSNQPQRNLAPPGMGGIKRNLPSQAKTEKPARIRFTLGETSKLKSNFKPIAQPSKDRGRDR